MKNLCLTLAFLCITALTFGQSLDVQGDAKVRGQLDIESDEGTNNIFIGNAVSVFNSTGENNTMVGVAAGTLLGTGDRNTFMGYQAGGFNQSGDQNCFIGANTGLNNVSGYQNVALGTSALINNIESNKNVAIGYRALYNFKAGKGTDLEIDSFSITSRSNFNIAIGYKAGENTNDNTENGAHQNIFIGGLTGKNNTTGFANTIIGGYAGILLNTGDNNTILGYFSEVSHNSNLNGQTAIGAGTSVQGEDATALGNGATVLNTSTNSTAIGAKSTVNISNRVVIGSTMVTSIGGHRDWTNYSPPPALITDTKENINGLDFILKLRPVSYEYDAIKLFDHVRGEHPLKAKGWKETPSKNAKKIGIHTEMGFLAEDVLTAAKKANFEFTGVTSPQHERDVYGIQYGKFTVPLVKAVQELHEQLVEEKAENTQLQTQVTELTTRLEKLEQILLSQNTSIGQVSETMTLDQTNTAHLKQNTPNPFRGMTLIEFYLPETVQNAQIQISDLQGKVLQTQSIATRGHASIRLNNKHWTAGVFTYSLIVDGQVVDGKKMVIK